MQSRNEWLFWEDSWNIPNEETCCGDWDEFGNCNCKKNKKWEAYLAK